MTWQTGVRGSYAPYAGHWKRNGIESSRLALYHQRIPTTLGRSSCGWLCQWCGAKWPLCSLESEPISLTTEKNTAEITESSQSCRAWRRVGAATGEVKFLRGIFFTNSGQEESDWKVPSLGVIVLGGLCVTTSSCLEPITAALREQNFTVCKDPPVAC